MSTFGSPLLPERFWVKVAPTSSGCWIWQASKSCGYGKFFYNRKLHTAHRVAFLALVGPIADGLHLDHLCRNRACVNPDHLEPVTCRVNLLRGIGPSAQHAVKTHCPSGHEYNDENTYLYRGMRMCRECRAYQNAKRSNGRAATEVRTNPGDRRHGTLVAYSTYQCRCDRCKACWRAYSQARRSKAVA